MNGVNLLDGFQLDNDTALNQYIELEVGAHAMSFVCDGNRTFALGPQIGLAEFDEQAFAVNGFQQSGPRVRCTSIALPMTRLLINSTS